MTLTSQLTSVPTVPLQATQTEVLRMIQENASLNASLWVNIALAGVSVLLFVAMGRGVESARARLIWVATLLVPLVSISSYAGLASGLTVGLLAMPAGHALAGQEVLSPWGRYLTWTFSTPMILLALGLLAGTDRTKLFTAITMDIGMCVTGLAAALITSSYLLRWVFYLISCAFFVAVLYVILVEWPRDAAAAGTSDIFETLKLLTVVLWLGYPILWALGSEGFALLSVAITSWGYSLLDIGAKYVFAFLLLRWVAANERVVDTVTTGTGAGSVASADD
ncbi:capsular biosynthesis protein CpsH [Salinigranum rubrum]|uniref:Capsular biosynthesis protein CpsH n=1 Tax=Salinigranum rubrum TaxID=755307 RepID=A0A2I8VPW5_9EURY|nr:bacteriorhodopsin [Salinigranum rubrum]AUV83159.1 capsular biosynthesis protein CpsH [Salinigranum rubrum]